MACFFFPSLSPQGCKCSCDCAQKLNCKGCSDDEAGGCSPCSCLSCCFCCSSCCDEPDEGGCGCLCLEVKLRSPRQGNSFRSQSSPTSSNKNEFKQFSTHYPPKKHSNGKIGLVELDWTDGDTISTGEKGSDVVRRRPTSLSPSKARSSLTTTSNQNSPNKRGNSARANSFLTRSSHPQFLENIEMDVVNSPNFSVKSNKSSNISRNNSTNSRRTVVSDGINDSSNETEGSFHRSSRNSRNRRSLKVGRQSQRFPQHILVNSQSEHRNVSSPQHSSNASQIPHFHSMPIQSQPQGRVSRRPLPPLKNSPHQTGLSRTT